MILQRVVLKCGGSDGLCVMPLADEGHRYLHT